MCATLKCPQMYTKMFQINQDTHVYKQAVTNILASPFCIYVRFVGLNLGLESM